MGGGIAYLPQPLKREKKFVNRILKLDYLVGMWGYKVTFFSPLEQVIESGFPQKMSNSPWFPPSVEKKKRSPHALKQLSVSMHFFGLGKLQTFLHDVHCASLSINTHEHTLSTLIKINMRQKKGNCISPVLLVKDLSLQCCNVECLRSFLESFSLTAKLAKHYLQVLFKF